MFCIAHSGTCINNPAATPEWNSFHKWQGPATATLPDPPFSTYASKCNTPGVKKCFVCAMCISHSIWIISPLWTTHCTFIISEGTLITCVHSIRPHPALLLCPYFPFFHSPLSHSLICASSSSRLLPIIQTNPHLLLHLLTKADNEPRWAVICFHGISTGFSTRSHTDGRALFSTGLVCRQEISHHEPCIQSTLHLWNYLLYCHLLQNFICVCWNKWIFFLIIILVM